MTVPEVMRITEKFKERNPIGNGERVPSWTESSSFSTLAEIAEDAEKNKMNADIRCSSERSFGYHEDHEGTRRLPLDGDCPARPKVRPTY